MKLKPWIAAVGLLVLYCIVSEMDYQDQVRAEDAKVAYRMQYTYAER